MCFVRMFRKRSGEMQDNGRILGHLEEILKKKNFKEFIIKYRRILQGRLKLPLSVIPMEKIVL